MTDLRRRLLPLATLALPCLAALAMRLVGGAPVAGGELHAPLLDEEAYRGALALLPLLGARAPLLGSLATLGAGILAVALTTILARRFAAPIWAAVAATLFALLPLAVEQTRLGRLEPQSLEPAIAIGFALCVLAHRGRARSAIAVALLAGAALLLPAPHLLCIGLGAGAALHAGLALGDRRAALGWTAATMGVVVLALLVRGPELLSALTPARSIWDPPPLGERSLDDLLPQSAVALLGYLPLAAPVLILLALLAPARDSSSAQRREIALLAAWSAAFVVAGLLQLRFLVTGLALAVPLCALGLAELARRLDQAAARRARPPLRGARQAAIALGSLTLLWPAVDYLEGGRPRIDEEKPLAFAAAARALRACDRGSGRVLVLSASGELGLRLGGMRVTSAPSRVAVPGSWSRRELEVAALLVSGPDADSEALAARLGLDWIALHELPSASARLILQSLELPFDRAANSFGHRRTLGARLAVDSGSGRPFTSIPLTAVSWLQHRWESRPVYGQPQLQLFRRVAGARILGQAKPGALVRLRLELISNRGRPFRYEDHRRVDREGSFAFRLPYPTTRAPSTEVVRHLAQQELLRHRLGIGARIEALRPLELPRTIPLGPARLSAPGLQAEVQVTEEDVERGRSRRIALGFTP